MTIEFPFSSSQVFDLALAEAAKHPSFVQFGEGKKALHRVTFALDSIDSALPLADLVKGWRNRAAYVNGEKTRWDDVFAFKSCYDRRQGSYIPDHYCWGEDSEWARNIWGCIRADMRWSEWGTWFCYGRFIGSKGEWEFDKARIRHELQTHLYHVRLCPALDTDLIESVLTLFPDRVNPSLDMDWKYVESRSEDSEEGIVIKRKSRWTGEMEEVRVSGVAPVGYGAARKIATRLKRQLHVGES